MRKVHVDVDGFGDDPDGLARAIGRAAHSLGVDVTRVAGKLHEHDEQAEGEAVPEAYVARLMELFDAAGLKLIQKVLENLALYLEQTVAKSFSKALPISPLQLTQEQVDELVAIIQQTFQGATITGGPRWQVPAETILRWKRMGLIAPDVSIAGLVQDSFIAGRLWRVLHDESSYEEMLATAARMPLTRADELAIQAVQRDAATYVTGFGSRLAERFRETTTGYSRDHLRNLIGAYLRGDLPKVEYPDPGRLQTDRPPLPREMEHYERPHLRVQSWRDLAADLYHRMKAVDAERDWRRLAVSEVRRAHNIGTLMEAAESGGSGTMIWYMVQPTACPRCKQTYLHPDGRPKLFRVEDVITHVLQNGGISTSPRSTEPTALLHPWCQCRPRRLIPGFPIPGYAVHPPGNV